MDVLIHTKHWRLGPDQAALAAQWFTGWVAAACEQRPDLTPRRRSMPVDARAQIAAAGNPHDHRGGGGGASPGPARGVGLPLSGLVWVLAGRPGGQQREAAMVGGRDGGKGGGGAREGEGEGEGQG